MMCRRQKYTPSSTLTSLKQNKRMDNFNPGTKNYVPLETNVLLLMENSTYGAWVKIANFLLLLKWQIKFVFLF